MKRRWEAFARLGSEYGVVGTGGGQFVPARQWWLGLTPRRSHSAAAHAVATLLLRLIVATFPDTAGTGWRATLLWPYTYSLNGRQRQSPRAQAAGRAG